MAPPTESDFSSSVQSHEGGHSKKDDVFRNSNNRDSPPPVISEAEKEAEQLDPIYVSGPRDLEDIYREMHPHFEGKESEGNWTLREKSIIKLRKITKGNSPSEYTTTYLLGIKGMLEGILKTVNSLRTTVSTNGCHLVQDIARAAGSGIDNMVEILLQSLIKLCGGTKTISAQNGNTTVNAILANVTYNVRLMQHIWNACQDKNVRPRSFATGWLKTIITKHSRHKSVLEHAGGLDLIEKCIKKGLTDANPGVRESMRPTYWAYWRVWQDKAEAILSTLDAKPQEQLLRDPSNPDPNKTTAIAPTSTGTKVIPASSRNIANAPSSRTSLKETIAAQKRAKLEGRLPDRPGSAQAFFSPVKPPISTNTSRQTSSISSISKAHLPATGSNPSQTGSLSSAPVRPMRPARRPELMRPATADPYTARQQMKSETPTTSPRASPPKSKLKTPAPPPSHTRSKTTGRIGTVPSSTLPTTAKKPVLADTSLIFDDVANFAESAEELTMVLPTMKSLGIKSKETAHETALQDPSNPASPSKTIIAEEVVSAPKSRRSGIPRSPAMDGHTPPKSTELVDLAPYSMKEIQNTSQRGLDVKKMTQTNLVHEEIAARKSMSPQAIFSKKENEAYTQQNMKRQQSPLKVYEDPEQPTDNDSTPRPFKSNVLGELPVNEPQVPLLKGEVWDPLQRQGWSGMEKNPRRVSDTTTEDPRHHAQRLLESGIVRIRKGALDIHGFRKLQSLMKSQPDIWGDGTKFDDLLLALLDSLDTFSETTKHVRDGQKDVKTQVLVTIRSMLEHQRKLFSTFYPRAMCALLSARKHHDESSHMVMGLEDTAEKIVAYFSEPSELIDAVLDLLESEEITDAGNQTVTMGLWVLRGVLSRDPKVRSLLDQEQQQRMGALAVTCLRASNPDIRRAVTEYTLELHNLVKPEQRFWDTLKGARDDHRSLITYYLARRDRT